MRKSSYSQVFSVCYVVIITSALYYMLQSWRTTSYNRCIYYTISATPQTVKRHNTMQKTLTVGAQKRWRKRRWLLGTHKPERPNSHATKYLYSVLTKNSIIKAHHFRHPAASFHPATKTRVTIHAILKDNNADDSTMVYLFSWAIGVVVKANAVCYLKYL